MEKKNYESRIRLSVVLIYILVALVCAGTFFYFYGIRKNMAIRKKSIEDYSIELNQARSLIYAVNQTQATINMFVVTRNYRYFRQYQELSQSINNKIDSLAGSHIFPQIDVNLSEVTELLHRKEQSIALLNRQFTALVPIDSLQQRVSQLTSSLQDHDTDSLTPPAGASLEAIQAGFLQRIFSRQKAGLQEQLLPSAIDSLPVVESDTLLIERFIEQARQDYGHHITAIEDQINAIVMADQYINSHITELLITLYEQIVRLRIEETVKDEAMARHNNTVLFAIGGSALFLILILLLIILRNTNKGYIARRDLEQANEEIRRLMESRHQLLLSISHDIKTPLNSLLGYTDLHCMNGLLSESDAAPIRQAGNHILILLDSLLEFSSLEKGSLRQKPTVFAPEELGGELQEMFLPLARQKSLDFRYEHGFPPHLTILADRLKIKRIATNLLSNAVKYTPQGSVAFGMTYGNGMLELRVTDTGAGIPSHKRKELFRPFSRVEENNALDEGYGFGLYVVKGLVDLLGGTIDLWSEPRKGTRVTIKIPAQECEKQAPDPGFKNILVLDDDPIYLKLLAETCRRLGHTVVERTSQAGFDEELPRIGGYDYVLTDMDMGDFTGDDVLKRIRSTGEKVRVVVISGRQESGRDSLLARGFDDFLPKPVGPADLLSLLGGVERQPDASSGLIGLDEQSENEVMDHFFRATVDHLVALQEAIGAENVRKVRFLCHKMGPMFLQTGASETITGIMRRADGMRETDMPDREFWETLERLPGLIEDFLIQLRERYSD